MAWEYEGLRGATIQFGNKKGEVAFELKRKDRYGDPYYIFKINMEHFNEEQKREWPEAWATMLAGAARLGYPLYDYQEIKEAVNAQLNLVVKSPKGRRAQRKVDETGKVVFIEDIKIRVFDHATGEIDDLTIGISTAPVDIVA